MYIVYSFRAGANNPLVTKFWCQQKGLITLPICCKFKKISFEVWFYTHFLMVLYMYIAPGQGQTTLGEKSWSQQKGLITLPICCKLKKKSLWSLILYIFFHVYIHSYSPGTGAKKPLESFFLYKHKPCVTLVICCKFLPLNDFLSFFLKECIFSHIKA